jgi:hypothetical protein
MYLLGNSIQTRKVDNIFKPTLLKLKLLQIKGQKVLKIWSHLTLQRYKQCSHKVKIKRNKLKAERAILRVIRIKELLQVLHKEELLQKRKKYDLFNSFNLNIYFGTKYCIYFYFEFKMVNGRKQCKCLYCKRTNKL